jgi:hypothetical protein
MLAIERNLVLVRLSAFGMISVNVDGNRVMTVGCLPDVDRTSKYSQNALEVAVGSCTSSAVMSSAVISPS